MRKIKHIKRCKKCNSKVKEFWGILSCPKCKWSLDILGRGIPSSVLNDFIKCSCGEPLND